MATCTFPKRVDAAEPVYVPFFSPVVVDVPLEDEDELLPVDADAFALADGVAAAADPLVVLELVPLPVEPPMLPEKPVVEEATVVPAPREVR
jgi:hypothetical protein